MRPPVQLVIVSAMSGSRRILRTMFMLVILSIHLGGAVSACRGLLTNLPSMEDCQGRRDD